ncbi:hypothetical protein NFI96_006283 [Prochilodus magdalenae]|nr:hypothetical protein NFI96_006283 [Prochilodus magdalenae]
MSGMFLLVPVVLLLVVPGCCGLWTVDRLIVRSGDSVTIPCHYNYRFREQVKYWCRGKNWYTCITVRKSAKVNITDSPAELVTTLTLSGLQVTDTGRYWCAIKRGGLMKADIRTSLELQVIKDTPDLWVNSSSVSGTEGGNATVQCYYSDRLKEDEKKWCRSGDLHSCQSQQDIQPSQNAKLSLVDEGQGVFTVTLANLQTDDGGWYWCMTGGIQAPVHVTVTTASTTQNYTESPQRTSPPLLMSTLSTPTLLTSTHTPAAHVTGHSADHTSTTSSNSTKSSTTSSPSTNSTTSSPSTNSFTIFLPSATSSIISSTSINSSTTSSLSSTSSTLTALTTHQGADPKGRGTTCTSTDNRVYVYLIVTGGILAAVAVVVSVFQRRRTRSRGNHMTVGGAEPDELSVISISSS